MFRLRVTAEILNVRNTPDGDPTFANWVGDLAKNTELDASEVVKGKALEGIDDWYKDSFNRFYWSGGVEKIADILSFDPGKMSWGLRGPDGIDLFSFWNNGLLGQNVKVAVLDSGINTSVPDLINAVKDKNLDLRDFTSANTIEDDFGHGTSCATMVASRGSTIFGSAPACDLIVGKIRTASEVFTPQKVVEALRWACDERQADVISMSFVINAIDPDIENFIESRSKPPHNKIFVASVSDAGKFSKDLRVSPANCKGAISIGSYGQGRIACITSGWNPELSFISPGDGLKAYDKDGHAVTLTCATSFACPFTVGLIACVIGFFKKNNKPYTADTIKELLFSDDCVDKLTAHNPLQHGKGIINANKLFLKLKSL